MQQYVWELLSTMDEVQAAQAGLGMWAGSMQQQEHELLSAGGPTRPAPTSCTCRMYEQQHSAACVVPVVPPQMVGLTCTACSIPPTPLVCIVPCNSQGSLTEGPASTSLHCEQKHWLKAVSPGESGAGTAASPMRRQPGIQLIWLGVTTSTMLLTFEARSPGRSTLHRPPSQLSRLDTGLRRVPSALPLIHSALSGRAPQAQAALQPRDPFIHHAGLLAAPAPRAPHLLSLSASIWFSGTSPWHKAFC